MTESLTITVVIACYNQESNIGKCIEAILRNKEGPLEIIVVDDSSTDNSIRRIEDLNEAKVKIITNSENTGIGYSRTKGMSKSKGDIVAVCDANSFVDENWLYEIGQSIKNLSTCVYGKVIPPNLTTFTKSILISESISSGIINKAIGNDAIVGHNFAITKKCLEDIGGYGSLPGWGSDALLYSKLRKNSKKIIYNKKMIVYKDYETGYYNLFKRRFRWGRGSRLSQNEMLNRTIIFRRFIVMSFLSVLIILSLNDFFLKYTFLPENSLIIFVFLCFFSVWFMGLLFNIITGKRFGLLEVFHLPFVYTTKGIATSTGYYYQLFQDLKANKND